MKDKVIIKKGTHVVKCKNGVGVVHADRDITASQWRGPFECLLEKIERRIASDDGKNAA